MYNIGMPMRWNELAKIRMKDLGMTQEKLSEHLGITPGAVSHWLNARRSPELEEIARILHILEIDEFKVYKDGLISPEPECELKQENTKKVHCYPVVNRDTIISKFPDIVSKSPHLNSSEWLESGALVTGAGFWYQIDGDSMLSPSGFGIPGGSIVLFDTGRSPSSNDLVLTLSADGSELNFKMLQSDGGKMLLVALNPRWPLSQLDDTSLILGVAVESRFRLI
jgi:SOS-response transcriptional repressor LexA